MSVSIIVPTDKKEIEECLDSLFSQKHPVYFEVIVVETPKFNFEIDSVCQKYRCTHLVVDNVGLTKAWQMAILGAKFDLIGITQKKVDKNWIQTISDTFKRFPYFGILDTGPIAFHKRIWHQQGGANCEANEIEFKEIAAKMGHPGILKIGELCHQ